MYFVFILVMLAVFVYLILVQWRIFKKAGRPGWHSIIPIYNVWSLYEFVGMRGWFGWMLIMSIIPIVGFLFIGIFTIIANVKLAKVFGRSTPFSIGLIFLSPIFYGILAFNKNIVYIEPIYQDYDEKIDSNISNDQVFINRLDEITEQINKLEQEKQEIINSLYNNN